jgi:PBSX family phage terminase large subunit
MMTTQTIQLYHQQGRFVGCSKHHVAFVAGIGSGKTIAGAVRSLLASQGYIGKRRVIPTPNLGVVTAPTYTMLRDATLRAFQQVAGEAISDFNKSEMLIRLRNGSEVLFRSTDNPDRLRGPSISWWHGDEAAMYEADTWNIMLGRLRQFGQQGFAWITTTPRGRNWVWQRFVRDATDDYRIFHAKSADNVHLDRAIVSAWEQSYVGDFARQELAGEFVAFEGLIYNEFDRALHISQYRPTHFKQVIAGVDFGFANPGVIQVVGLDSDGRAYLVHEEYQRQRQIDEWANVAKQLRELWHIETFYCDPSEPDYIKKFNAQPGVHAVGANNSVQPGIQVVKARLMRQADGRPRLFISPTAVNTIAEFESYQWLENRYGVRDEPLKSGDHAMDALRYALMGIDKLRQPVRAEIRRYA